MHSRIKEYYLRELAKPDENQPTPRSRIRVGSPEGYEEGLGAGTRRRNRRANLWNWTPCRQTRPGLDGN